jgi:hypothetical protein
MTCRTLFISQQDFKDRVDLSENVLSKYIIPSIALVQDRYIKKILCPEFYDELIEQVADDDLTDDNETLVNDYIKPAMVYRAYARYISNANIFSTPSGFRKYSEENSEAATTADLAGTIAQAESDAQFYENELREFLENNEDDYPTFRDNCNCPKPTTGFKVSKIGDGFKKDKKIDLSGSFYSDYLDDNGNPK